MSRRDDSDEDAEAVDIDAKKLQKSPTKKGKNPAQSQNSSNFGSQKNLKAHIQSSELKPMGEPSESQMKLIEARQKNRCISTGQGPRVNKDRKLSYG